MSRKLAGYNLSDNPKGVDAYGIDTVAADVVGLIPWAGRQKAIVTLQPSRPPSVRVTVPTVLIWDVRYQFLKREMAQPSIDLFEKGRVVFLENATHWVQHEEAKRVNELIVGRRGRA